MSERLTPGTPPRFHAARRPGRSGAALDLRAHGHRLLLPGGHDPWLHHAGVRLQRQPRRAACRGLRGARRLADKPEKLAKFRERDGLTITLLSDADKAVMKEWGAFGEKLYGKVVEGGSAAPWWWTKPAQSPTLGTT